jgi:pyruvate/2-oxoglutarate dehydrogenase complex dihydrolipoamide acyltransferase (E2) component
VPRVWVPSGQNSAGDQMTRRHYTANDGSYDEDGGDLRYTEAAYDRAQELGVDISTVTGTGKNGRITVGDVENAT